MSIVPYNPRTPVAIASMYVCGHLHRTVFSLYARNAVGEWEECGHHWFNTMSEAVVWAISECRPIVNWNECAPELAYEDICRQEWEQWCRAETVRRVLPAVPLMITYSGGL